MSASTSYGHTAARGYVREYALLFDHLIGRDEQAGWYFQLERFCRLDVEGGHELGRRLHWEISGLGAAQNAIDVVRDLSELVDPINPIGHEPASGNKERVPVYRREAVLGCERDDEIAMGIGRAVSYDY